MLERQLADVANFHQKVTGQPMPDVPTMLIAERRDYALKFLGEELTEFADATTIADQADALVDLVYVAYGRLLEMGIRPGPAFSLVHAANLSKVRGKNKRGETYEAEKPAGWAPPDWDGHLGLKKGSYIGLSRDAFEEQVLKDADLSLRLNREPDPRREVDQFGGPRPRVKRPKVLLLGHGRHGKDTVAEMLRDKYGLTFTSSSMACAEHVMLPLFQKQREEFFKVSPLEGARLNLPCPQAYNSVDECFADRHNHRPTWFKAIEEFNTPDKASLGRMIFGDYDIYCGLRSAREFAAVRNAGLYDFCIWIDALQRHPAEDRSSCTVEPWMADYIVDNNGTLDELAFNVDQLMETITRKFNAR